MPNLREASVFALSLLSESDYVPIEDVAYKCFQLDPHAFSWTRYRKFPDKEKTRMALSNAKKARYGKLVVSSSNNWKLTENGLKWVESNRNSFNSHYGLVIDDEKEKEILDHYNSHPLYQHYLENGIDGSSEIDFANMIGCLTDWPINQKSEMLQAKISEARIIGDDKLLNFLEECKEHFLKSGEKV